MKTRITGYLVLALLLAGCGEKKTETKPLATPPVQKKAADTSETPAPPPAPTAPAPGAAVDAQGQMPADAAAGEVKEDPNIMSKADALNLVVENYITSYGKPPSSLDELVQKKFIPRLPDAPAGKKFAYDMSKKKVTLVNK